jgi:hypothetical protein
MNSYVNITIRPLILCNILLKLPNELQEIIIEYLNNKDILIGNLKYKTRFILFNMYPSLYIKNYEYSELKSSEKIYIINNYNGSKFKKLLTNTDKQEDLKQNYHINDLSESSESNILVKIKYSNKKSLYGDINLIKENKINNRKLYNKKKKTKQIKYDRLIKYDNIISCDWKYVYSDYIDFLNTTNTNTTNTNTTDNDYGNFYDDYYYDDDNDDDNDDDDYDNDSNIAKLRNRRHFYDYDDDLRKIRYFIDERFL